MSAWLAGWGFRYPWGTSGNILCFFISGLPGGLDYFLLAAGTVVVIDGDAIAVESVLTGAPRILHLFSAVLLGRLTLSAVRAAKPRLEITAN